MSNPSQLTSGLGISIFKSQLALEAYQRLWRLLFRRCRRLGGGIYRWNGVPLLCLRRTMPKRSLASGGQCRRDGQAYRERIDLPSKMTILCGTVIIVHRLKSLNWGTLNCSCWTSKAMDQMISCLLESKVDLRRNSNISTGGDSIDVTDSIHPSYKELAADMAKAMGPEYMALISSSPDSSAIFTKENPNCTCIELQLQSFYVYAHPIVLRGPGQSITRKY